MTAQNVTKTASCVKKTAGNVTRVAKVTESSQLMTSKLPLLIVDLQGKNVPGHLAFQGTVCKVNHLTPCVHVFVKVIPLHSD